MAMRKRDDEAVFPDAAGMTLGHQSHSVAAHQPQVGCVASLASRRLPGPLKGPRVGVASGRLTRHLPRNDARTTAHQLEPLRK